MHAFIKKNMVMVIALLAAAITSIIIPPDRAYLGYFDLKTLTCLFCVLAVVCALKNINFFYMLARKVVKCFKNARMSILALVYITFIGSMLIANDMALLTFLPLGYLVLTTTGKQRYMAFTFVMQNIAANLGGMLTPFGNPQNLYLYSHYHLGMGAFLRIMLPFALLSLLLILLALLRGKNQPLSFGLSEMQTVSGAAPFCRKSLLSYLLMFLLCLGAVGKWIPIPFLLLAVVCLGLFADSAIFSKVDYSLLITFAGFFIFIGNMKQIPWISSLFQQLITGNELLCSVAVSQVISNVPAALLLSGFTDQGTSLLIGTNLGGLGTLIASMASLISYKFFVREHPQKRGAYLLFFTGANLLFPVSYTHLTLPTILRV
mgnify:CR=1 FL=1